jgi:protein SCO1
MPSDRRLLATLLPALALALTVCAVASGATTGAPTSGTAAGVATPAGGPSEAPSLYDLESRWTDQRGDTLRLAHLAGTVRVVAMVYTSCAATCPLIVADLRRVAAAVPAAQRERVGLVLVSLDPARDTPGRLAAWAAQARLDPARWTLLAGSDDDTRELAAALGVRYEALPGGEVAHTNVVTVLDRRGRLAHQQSGLGAGTAATTRAVLDLLR